MKSTQLAHRLIKAKLFGGEIVVDATAGNGHDTLFWLILLVIMEPFMPLMFKKRP